MLAEGLARKLGVRDGAGILLAGASPNRQKSIKDALPSTCRVDKEDLDAGSLDIVIFWPEEKVDLLDQFKGWKGKIKSSGSVWVAIPKKRKGVEHKFTFGVIQTAGLKAGLVDNKQAAFAEEEYLVRFVVPLKQR